jgi:hypothetical protein
MKRTLTTIAAAALASVLLVPAATAQNSSPNPKQVANQICHDQKKGMDKQDFKQLYNGGKRAMQTCKRQNQPEAEEIVQNSAQDCRTEETDAATFAATYGDKKNAFGKCVSTKSKTKSDELVEETTNAAQECHEERDTMGDDAFREEHGRNAFGKCVSEKVHEEEPEPAPTV